MLVNLEDSELDTSVYRIYKLKYFESLLKNKSDTLITPNKWDDPFENFFLTKTKVIDDETKKLISIDSLASDLFGQCWSLTSESDAMWRIYSTLPESKSWTNIDDAKNLGIKARTTISRLHDNLNKSPHAQIFIGKVKYVKKSEIEDFMNSVSFTEIMDGSYRKFIELLCIKREAFKHEREVRILINNMSTNSPKEEDYKYNLDANSVFNEIVLDPRLTEEQAEIISQHLKSCGCKLNISRSDLYDVPEYTIKL